MLIPVQCPFCEKKLKVPESSAGKRAKCPSCANIFKVPEIITVMEAEDVATNDAVGASAKDDDNEDFSIDEERKPVSTEQPEESRRPCPMCGEMIVTTAAKCRYCGEIFDPTLKKSVKKKKKRQRSSSSSYDDDMSGADWLIALLCPGIGCIIGIVRMIQGNGSGGKMIGVSFASAAIGGVIRAVIESMHQR